MVFTSFYLLSEKNLVRLEIEQGHWNLADSSEVTMNSWAVIISDRASLLGFVELDSSLLTRTSEFILKYVKLLEIKATLLCCELTAFFHLCSNLWLTLCRPHRDAQRVRCGLRLWFAQVCSKRWIKVLQCSWLILVMFFFFFSELYYDRGNHHEFVSLVKDLARPGELTQSQTYDFEFTHVEKPYESYTGQNVKLR